MIKHIYKDKVMFIPKLKKEINTNEITEQYEAVLTYLGYGWMFEQQTEVTTEIEYKKRKRKNDFTQTGE
jgi:hypothetical protein